MFRSCEKCRFYTRDRKNTMFMGKIRNMCRAKNDIRINKPFHSGVFCKKFEKRS